MKFIRTQMSSAFIKEFLTEGNENKRILETCVFKDSKIFHMEWNSRDSLFDLYWMHPTVGLEIPEGAPLTILNPSGVVMEKRTEDRMNDLQVFEDQARKVLPYVLQVLHSDGKITPNEYQGVDFDFLLTRIRNSFHEDK